MRLESKLLVSLVLGNDNKARELVSEVKDWVYFLKLASSNRLLYFSSQRLLEVCSQQLDANVREALQVVVNEGDASLENQRRSLKKVSELLGNVGVEFLVAKTFKNFDYVFNDLDLLVGQKDFEKATTAVAKLGHSSVCREKRQVDFVLKNAVKIDLHRGFHWYGGQFLEEDFLWRNLRRVKWADEEWFVPCCETEFLLTVLNLLFEKHYLPLLDFHYLHSLLENGGDLAVCQQQANRNSWGESFAALVSEFRSLNFDSTFPRLISARTSLISFSQALSVPRVSKKVVFKDFFYRFFSGVRFYLTSGQRVPVYGHWFDFGKLKSLL